MINISCHLDASCGSGDSQLDHFINKLVSMFNYAANGQHGVKPHAESIWVTIA